MPPKKKKVSGLIKLQIQAGQATPAPPVGPALGAAGVNMMEFVKAYKAKYGADKPTSDPMEAAYVSVYLWKNTVEKAQSFDVKAIQDNAGGVSFDAPEGKVTIDGVSRAAGVTRGAFYWHFKDKAELLGALYARSMLPKELILSIAAETGSDPLCSLMDAGVASLREFEEDEGKQRMFRIMSDMTIGDDARTNLARVDAELDALILRVMTCAKDTGGLHPEICAREAAVFVGVTIGGLLNRHPPQNVAALSESESLRPTHQGSLRQRSILDSPAPTAWPLANSTTPPRRRRDLSEDLRRNMRSQAATQDYAASSEPRPS